MKVLRKLIKFSGMLLIASMFSVCMVMGIVPIIARRKQQFEFEIKIEQVERVHGDTVAVILSENKS